MQRNSTTLFLESPNAITPIPWGNGNPDFSGFEEPTLSVLLQAWQDFLDSGQELEIISDPVPPPELLPEQHQPDWRAYNIFMLSDEIFRNYRNNVREIDPELTSALFNAYGSLPNEGLSMFKALWNFWCEVGNVSDEHKEYFATVAESEAHHLPSDFCQVLRGN